MRKIIGGVVLTIVFACIVMYLYIFLCIIPGLKLFPEQLKILSIMKTHPKN